VDTRLTLRLDVERIRAAKRRARRSGKSVSKVVADYFALIDAATAPADAELKPRARSLREPRTAVSTHSGGQR